MPKVSSVLYCKSYSRPLAATTRRRRGVVSVAQDFTTFLSTRARPGRDTWEMCTDVEVLAPVPAAARGP
jgi:hypothetical protein